MNITVNPLILNKTLILKKVSEEQLMEFYLGVPVRKGLFKSPLRADNNPTCAFFRNRQGILIFKDFRGDFYGDVFEVVQTLHKCSFYKALQIIANDFGIIDKPELTKNTAKLEYTNSKLEETKEAIIQVEIRDFQQYELNWWKKYGITEQTLKKFNVFSCKNVFLNGNLFHLETKNQHIYGYYGGTDSNNIELWRIYFAQNKKMRFISNWKATKIQGAKQLNKNGGDFLVITKSLKDVMCLYEYGIPAIAPNSENLFVTTKQYEKLKTKFKKIFVFYDCDLAGIENMNKIRKMYPDVIPMFIPRSYNTKDISDFRAKYGKHKTQDLINQAKDYYLNGKENR